MSFLMDEGTNELLAAVRSRLEEDLSEGSKKDEEPMGDDDEEDLPTGDDDEEDDEEEDEEEYESLVPNAHALDVLERVRERLTDELGEGTGQANNVPDVDATLDAYLNAVMDRILSEFEIEEDDAITLIYDTADALAASGQLPVFPDEDASYDDVAIWIGKAKTLGFDNEVIKAAE